MRLTKCSTRASGNRRGPVRTSTRVGCGKQTWIIATTTNSY
jgi:hypothetical protein